MLTSLNDLFKIILAASLLGVLLGYPMKRIAFKFGLVDYPGAASHKTHGAPTVMAGGLILPFTLILPLIIIWTELNREVMIILGGTAGMILLGIVDDRIALKPGFKLIGQFVIVGFAYLGGVQVHITQTLILDLMITCLWMLGITNAFNFVDSKDGLAIGLAGISAAFLMLVTVDSLQPALAFLSAAILGSCIGLFFFNISPARFFLGDSGAQALGFCLAAAAIAYTPAQAGLPQGVTWFIPILLLGVPIFDMVLVVVSRIRHRKPVYRAGTDHVYHRLERLGIEPNRAVAAMQILAILLGLIAFIALDMEVLEANLLFLLVVLSGLVLLVVLERILGKDEISS